ncbi:hypothetical protein [Deinococcus peraridilitoris]|uniref:hypothetical protein n=1 Tax=Deinococcus peraridilitoris TaxID=432329 RepID=UPI0002DBF994|nr:hypothetical protein [Deinococcus peraridilitoris]
MTQHDYATLITHLHRSPADFAMHSRARSLQALQELDRTHLPNEYRRALLEEIEYRKRRPWMHDARNE